MQNKFDQFYVTTTYCLEEEMESVKWEVGMELWYIFVPFSSHTSGSVGKWRHNKSSTKVQGKAKINIYNNSLNQNKGTAFFDSFLSPTETFKFIKSYKASNFE